MIRILFFLAWLIPALACATPPTIIQPPTPLATATTKGIVLGTPYAYFGPCDYVSCAEAYSVTRAMTAAYTGPLFQLVRASDSNTMDVPQYNHVADLRGILAFCALTTCNYSVVYGEINGNDLTPTNGTGRGGSPCVNATVCAPLFFIDPETGLPIIRTGTPSQLYNQGIAATGIRGGASAISVAFYGRNEGWSGCCGLFGPAHSFVASDVTGQDFLPGLTYGTGNAYSNCSLSTTICSMLDIEGYMKNGADYSPTSNQDVLNLWTFDGVAGTNLLTDYVNSPTAINSALPYNGTVMNVGGGTVTIRIGGGGDGTHVDGILRDAIISNANIGPQGYVALANSETGFYAGRRPNACQSTGDFGYYTGPADGPMSTASTMVAYALRRMSASYFGPIASLTDSEGSPVTQTFGPASSGCGLDPAAATFCAANAPCRVTKIWNQGTAGTGSVINVHDPSFDLVQATVANAPTVNFSGPNGNSVMVFSGSQQLCSGTLPASVAGAYMSFYSFVAERTGGTSAASAVLSMGNVLYYIGYFGAANFAEAYMGNAGQDAAATDNVYHSVVWEATGATGSVTGTIYVDGVSKATQSAIYVGPNTQSVCIGATSASAHPFTGNVAEVIAGLNATPGGLQGATVEPTIFSLQELAWGNL